MALGDLQSLSYASLEGYVKAWLMGGIGLASQNLSEARYAGRGAAGRRSSHQPIGKDEGKSKAGEERKEPRTWQLAPVDCEGERDSADRRGGGRCGEQQLEPGDQSGP